MDKYIDWATRAIQADAELRTYLGLRCGYHPDMLAMSVAGYTVGEVTARYRAELERVVREQGTDAIDTSVAHLVRDGNRVEIVDDAFDIRPMFHGVQRAVRATVAAAATEQRLEERVLAEVAACLLDDGVDITLADDAFADRIRQRARESERCTGSVSRLAIDFAQSVASTGVRRANIEAASLIELEQMLRLRPVAPSGMRLPGYVRPLPVVAVFRDGFARLPVNHAVWALQNAIRDAILGVGWARDPARSIPAHVTPTNHGRGSVTVSLRDDSQRGIGQTAFDDLWAQVRALDDMTADALLVCLAHWAGAGEDEPAPVWITADAILDARGLQRIRRRGEPGTWQHGHRREDRLEAARALAQLDKLWLDIVDVEVIPGRGEREPKPLRAESRALAILDRVTERDAGGEEVFLAARVLPGQWAQSLWNLGLRQTGFIAQQALAYDPYRERPERWLARYLALAFRWNARRRTPDLRRRVASLLDNAALVPDTSRPQRCRDRLERALDRLSDDGVIDGWQYESDPADLPARHWFTSWTEMTIRITPPDVIRRRSTGIGRASRNDRLPGG